MNNKSVVNMLICLFVKNSAAIGGSVSIRNSKLMITSTQSSLINIAGEGSPLRSHSSDLNVIDSIFNGNNIQNL